MFNNSFDVVNRDFPVQTTTQSNFVNDSNKYEGKDNPGVPWYYRRNRKKKDKKEKNEKPKGNHTLDVIA